MVKTRAVREPHALKSTSRVLGLCLPTFLAGCFAAPGVPGGPLQKPGIQTLAANGYAVGPGTATLRSREDGTVRTVDDTLATSVGWPPLTPARLNLRVAPTPWMDAAAEVGFLDGGAELRFGLPEGSEPLPVNLALAMRTDLLGMISPYDTFDYEVLEWRARVEAYPPLVDGKPRIHFVAALGASWGKRTLFVAAPGEITDTYEDPFYTQLPLVRWDARLEGAMGFDLRTGHGVLQLVVMPYAVLAADDAEAPNCGTCRWELTASEHRFGATFFISYGLSFAFHRSDRKP